MSKSKNNNSIDQPLAIIGGHTLSTLPGFKVEMRRIERTPFGETSSPIKFGKIGNKSIAYLARHGFGSNLENEDINDLANIYALSKINAKAIVGISSAISLFKKIKQGDILIPNQLIDIGNNKISRFPKTKNVAYHPLQFADPYDEFWRSAIIKVAKNQPKNVKVHIDGSYILTSGLRSETRAEAFFYRQIGGSAIGATGAQEAALARDLAIPYVAILVIVRQSMDLESILRPIENFLEVAEKISNWLINL